MPGFDPGLLGPEGTSKFAKQLAKLPHLSQILYFRDMVSDENSIEFFSHRIAIYY